MGAMENENRITIPDFSKDDFLISSKPFQWIIDQADGNEFIKGQLVAANGGKAKELVYQTFGRNSKTTSEAEKGSKHCLRQRNGVQWHCNNVGHRRMDSN